MEEIKFETKFFTSFEFAFEYVKNNEINTNGMVIADQSDLKGVTVTHLV